MKVELLKTLFNYPALVYSFLFVLTLLRDACLRVNTAN